MLFDLSQDPGEQHDLAESEPLVREDLMARMTAIHRELVARQKKITAQHIDTQTLDRLKSLGYVQ